MSNPYAVLDTLDTFTRAYIECALWSSTDDDGNPLDDGRDISDMHPSAIERMRTDCEAFQASHYEMIESDLSRAGHDFWLTRNGHGAGFWDGDWPKETEDILTDAAHAFGEADLYIGDDDLIYHFPE